MSRLSVLLLGPICHPKKMSIPFVTYSHAAALSEMHDVTMVASAAVADDLRSAGAPFRSIEVVHTPFLDWIFAWIVRVILRNRHDSQIKTAFRYPAALAFEWRAWRQLKRRIYAG